MIDFIFPVLLTSFAVFFIILSKSEKNFQKLVENNGEKFANKVNNGLKVCGYLLLVCLLAWLVIHFFFG